MWNFLFGKKKENMMERMTENRPVEVIQCNNVEINNDYYNNKNKKYIIYPKGSSIHSIESNGKNTYCDGQKTESEYITKSKGIPHFI